MQFVRQDGFLSQPFYFFQHFDHPSSTTWQVWRSEFDKMIMDKARENGATVMEETKAKNLIKSADNRVEGVKVASEDFGEVELRAPIVVDASGRDCFSAHKQNWMVRDPELKKVALWTYYKGAKRDPGLDEGATTVAYLPDKGWFCISLLAGIW